MIRYIKVPIETMFETWSICGSTCQFIDSKICYCKRFDKLLIGCYVLERCQACLEADITDLLSENEALKKRNAVLERALEIACDIMIEQPEDSYRTNAIINREPEYFIAQAQKELEESDDK